MGPLDKARRFHQLQWRLDSLQNGLTGVTRANVFVTPVSEFEIHVE